MVDALSLTSNVNNWLANTRSPRILHIFDHACNLINERREVISVVTVDIGDGPFNLVVEDNLCFSEHLSLQSPVSISQDQLALDNFTIHTTDVKLWNPRPDWQLLHAKKESIFLQLTELRITSSSNSYGLNMPFAKTTQDSSTSASLQSFVSALSSALALADFPSSGIAAEKLAGLGPGLTPSGDDYLMGALYAVWIIHPFTVANVLANRIANTAAPLTTSLSAAWIRSAGKGEAGILWHDFFDALASTSTLWIRETMKKILAVGETSGADALAGFAGVFASWMGQTGSSHG